MPRERKADAPSSWPKWEKWDVLSGMMFCATADLSCINGYQSPARIEYYLCAGSKEL